MKRFLLLINQDKNARRILYEIYLPGFFVAGAAPDAPASFGVGGSGDSYGANSVSSNQLSSGYTYLTDKECIITVNTTSYNT